MALSEELQTALNLCSHRRKIRLSGIPVWTAGRGEEELHFVKLGVGPIKSALVLERILDILPDSRILVAGYAGALDPGLRLGNLVVVEKAHRLAREAWGAPPDESRLAGSWALSGARGLHSMANAAGIEAHLGSTLTSPGIVGDPEQKQALFERFKASVVEMETAALAQVAAARDIPMDCVRAVSDEAGDDFLAPFSYDPDTASIGRAARILRAGRLTGRYRKWRECAAEARRSLRRFLTWYLDSKVWRRHP